MNTKQIHEAFDKLLETSPAGHALQRRAGITAQQAATYRYLLKKRARLKLETKLHYLKLAGLIDTDRQHYTKNDMLSFARFALHPKNKQALTLGMDYLLDKWHAIPKKPRPR